MSAWCPQRVLSCLLWLGLAVACALGGTADAASRRDALELTAPVAIAAVPVFDAAACDRIAADCPAVPGDRYADDPMKRRHVARRALAVVDVTADLLQPTTPLWAVLPAADDASVAAYPHRGLLPATRTTRNAQRRRHLRVLGGRAPPVVA